MNDGFKQLAMSFFNPTGTVVTRFAPSPTGFLHLGGARTALFNWLYARHYKGKFFLRLEDTDLERSKSVFQEDILESLRWLDLMWDDAIVIQSARKTRHQAIAKQLLNEGKAYRCLCTSEELAEMKAQALSQGFPPLYDRRWREKEAPEGMPYTLRLKVPLHGKTILEDGVQGTITVDQSTLDDMVLLRSDGTPTYMLAVVVDDHDMGVTHILRGDDHLTNAFRQLQIYNACGWNPPHMAHIPLIHDASGGKLSKRHGAVSVSSYRDLGILPQALENALLRLGWAHGNEERISRDQAIEWFDGKNLNRAPARFDLEKVWSLNAHYLRQKSPDVLWALLEPLLDEETKRNREKAFILLPALQQRAKTLDDIVSVLPIYTHEHFNPPGLDQKDKAILSLFMDTFKADTPWTPEALEESMRAWASSQAISFGALAKPLRLALTGQPVSPSLPEVMATLGKRWTLQRIEQAIFFESDEA